MRYKHYQLVGKPAPVYREGDAQGRVAAPKAGLVEAESVKEFGRLMEERGVYGWWKAGMGFANQDQ